MEDSGTVTGEHIHSAEPTVVAVDGPAGSGKSSVSLATARKLGYGFLDTGSAYRALAWFANREGVDREDAAAVLDLLPRFDFAPALNADAPVVSVNGIDATAAIRTPETTASVSAIARIPGVREFFNSGFRRRVASSGMPGVIVEGRDITTVVFPDAPVRILLTADEAVRAVRRSAEHVPTQPSAADTADTARQLRARDAADSEVVDFMNAAEGVTVVDSTTLNFDETVDAVITVIRAQAVKEKA